MCFKFACNCGGNRRSSSQRKTCDTAGNLVIFRSCGGSDTRQPTHLWNWSDNLKNPYILMGQIPFLPSRNVRSVTKEIWLPGNPETSNAMSGRKTTETDHFPPHVIVFAKRELLLMLQLTNKIQPDRCENKTWLCVMKLSENFGLNYLSTVNKGCWSVLNH